MDHFDDQSDRNDRLLNFFHSYLQIESKIDKFIRIECCLNILSLAICIISFAMEPDPVKKQNERQALEESSLEI